MNTTGWLVEGARQIRWVCLKVLIFGVEKRGFKERKNLKSP